MLQVLKNKRFWSTEVNLKSGFPEFAQRNYPDSLFWVTSTGSSSKNLNKVKWVGIDEESFVATIGLQCDFLNINEDDKILNTLPPSHIAYLAAKARAEVSRCEFIDLYDKNYRWNAKEFKKCFLDHQISLASLVPTQVYDLVHSKIAAPEHAHRILVGGGYLLDSLIESAKELGWVCLRSYGATETGSFIAANSLSDFQSNDFSLCPLESCELSKSQEGKLKIKYPNLFTKYIYWDESSKQAQSLFPNFDEESYWLTEDFVEFHEKGFEILGRGNRFAKVLGENINLDKVEAELKSDFDFDFCVLAKKDLRKGMALFLVYSDPALDITYFQEILGRKGGLVQSIQWINFPIPKAENSKVLYEKLLSDLKKNNLI